MQRGHRSLRLKGWPAYFLLLLAGLLLYQLTGFRTVAELRSMWRQEQHLEADIEKLVEENSRIEAAIKELSPEGSGIERIARQDLGWAQPGEIVVKIPDKK